MTPEVRLERGERVVGDLGRRRGQRGEQRGLAGVGQADQPDVGDQPQLEAQLALLAGLALLGVAGGLVGGGREVRCCRGRRGRRARPSSVLADGHEVGEQVAGSHRRRRAVPGGTVEVQVLAGLAVRFGAPEPRPPGVALKWWAWRKSRSVVWPGSTRR